MTTQQRAAFRAAAAAVCLALVGAGAACATGGGAAAPAQLAYRDGLEGVDFSGLSAAEKERALVLLNEQGCDCGCGMKLAECRVRDQKCPRSPDLARAVLAGVKSGRDSGEIVADLKEVPFPGRRPAALAAEPDRPVGPSTRGAPAKGNTSGRVTIVVFSDFQCPYCARAVPVVHELARRWPADVQVAFKQFPLTSIHPRAEAAARASLAAARQGRFWEMHDLLFANQKALDDASLRSYAGRLGLDLERFDGDLADPALRAQVEEDLAEGRRAGVSGTPTFYVNGVQAPTWDLALLGRLVEAARSGGDLAAIAAEEERKLEEARAVAARRRQEETAREASRVVSIDTSGSPVKGNPSAPITIVEFADFQCPYCAQAQGLVRQVLEAYPDQVKLAFKHMPLSFHQGAVPAALASAEALKQGKFWEMHDLLFANFTKLTREDIRRYASRIGMDPGRVDEAIEARTHGALIEKDMADAEKAGVTGTPAFYVNGRKVMQRDFTTFKRMIDEALSGPAAGRATGS